MSTSTITSNPTSESKMQSGEPSNMPESNDKLSIHVRDLNLWYGDFQALKNVSIDIRKGIITGLIGPSGCGKTTLLRCFNRINERYENVKTTGEIEILDKNIYDDDVTARQLRRRIGMVFQNSNPFLPTLEGQYIIKNIIIITAALMIGRSYLKVKFFK